MRKPARHLGAALREFLRGPVEQGGLDDELADQSVDGPSCQLTEPAGSRGKARLSEVKALLAAHAGGNRIGREASRACSAGLGSRLAKKTHSLEYSPGPRRCRDIWNSRRHAAVDVLQVQTGAIDIGAYLFATFVAVDDDRIIVGVLL